jgi:hypothetical protein
MYVFGKWQNLYLLIDIEYEIISRLEKPRSKNSTDVDDP